MACGATLKRSLDFDPLHSPGQRSPKRRRCIPMAMSSTPPAKVHNNSPFGEVSPKLTSEQIAANIACEIKRIQRRKQLTCGSPQASGSSSPPRSPPLAFAPPTDAVMPQSCASAMASSASHFPSRLDTPLFTYRQVSLYCERMLKEREDQIRQQYDQVLSAKLAEQYESFLKFNYDQIQRRMGEQPASYFS